MCGRYFKFPLNLPQPSLPSDGAVRLSGLARLVRRICVLREQGDATVAAQLEKNDLANAVRDLRLAEGLDAVSAEELRAIFATEERRVADASVLAELLLPQLRDAWANAPKQSSGASAGIRRESPVAAPAPRVTEPVAGSPAITDLLDAMLAADGATRRQSASRRVDQF